ncbi:MAG: Mut7-C RNAse domain-containing protein [Anaerolineales bacterium]
MSHAYFRFYSELKDFLSASNQQIPVQVELAGHETVKHLVEMLGVPHTEIDLLLVNGKSVDFDYQIQVGEFISVYPVFESLDIQAVSKVRQKPLRIPRFVVDIHLGKLAGYLRLLGFDTLYRNDFQDNELAEISSAEVRILLTRDRGLLKRKVVTRGYLVREDDPKEQIHEIVRRFDLAQLAVPFSRCSLCNGILSTVSKRTIEKDLEPLTKEHYHHFKQCPDCNQIYWKGSHFGALEKFIRSILNKNQETSI